MVVAGALVLTSAISMPRSRAIAGAFTMFTEFELRRSTPISAHLAQRLDVERGHVALDSIDDGLDVGVGELAGERPSFSARSRKGLSRGAPRPRRWACRARSTMAPVSR